MTNIGKLRRARKRIERGWCRGELIKDVNGQTCFCAVGAIICRADKWDGDPDFTGNLSLIEMIAEYLPAQAKRLRAAYVWSGWTSVVQWNNDLLTSKADILAFFDRAIEGMSKKSGRKAKIGAKD